MATAVGTSLGSKANEPTAQQNIVSGVRQRLESLMHRQWDPNEVDP
ncbi:hypothetical protein [Nitrospira sp. Nam74]